jgi:multiple sugar transport system substrate-binding protein
VISPTPHRLRRVAVTSTIVIASLAAVTACSSSTPSDGPVESITVWTGLPYDSFQTPNAALFATCEKETGITAKLEDFPPDDLTGKVLQAATSGDLPDLLYLESGDISRVVETGLLTDLADYDLSAEGYGESVAELGAVDGVQYGLAPGVNPIALFYNKAMFEAAGVEVPTTFDELRAAAAALTTPDVMGIALSADTGAGPYHFLPYLLGAGGDPADIATPEAAEALQLWKDFVADGSTSESAVTWGWDAQDYFRSEKAAMVMSGAWLFGEGLPFDIGVFPVPTSGGSGEPQTPIGAEVWTIPVTDDAHQAAAAKMLACLTDDANALEMARASGRIPGDISVGEKYAAEFPEQAPLIALLPNGFIQDPEKKGKQYEQLSLAIQDALANDADPAAALEKAAGQ